MLFKEVNRVERRTQLFDDLRARRISWEPKEEAEDLKRWKLQSVPGDIVHEGVASY